MSYSNDYYKHKLKHILFSLRGYIYSQSKLFEALNVSSKESEFFLKLLLESNKAIIERIDIELKPLLNNYKRR